MPQVTKPGDARLRLVPSVDQLLRTEAAVELSAVIGMRRLTALARVVTAEIRTEIKNETYDLTGKSAEDLLAAAGTRLQEIASQENRSGLTNVINATGVVLHTNLGRAPLSKAAQEAITNEAAGYCTLEYDKASGLRGKRGARVEALLKELTGAEDALVVNNCAAAALLVLGVLAADGETIVSRGELVEIGGDFRVPDVMASSGTRMVEVGTTNKTHLDDYRKAITSKTRLIMRVHPSNYRIVGFTSSPGLNELVSLAHQAMVPLYEDAGSGQLIDLSHLGVEGEPIVSKLIEDGADLVSFSGDKLLGSVQAGLIVGKRSVVDRLRRHPLYRALRSDKIRLAALEATLVAHQAGRAESEVPVLFLLGQSKQEITTRAESLLGQLSLKETVKIELLDGESAIGGGSGPTANLPTTLIAVSDSTRTAQELETLLRTSSPPIIARIADEKVLIDLRTVFPAQEATIIHCLSSI
ncbi:MAG TPA: L-seryl-tRNA(Sec) selenium transferase [Pyrinomonadaceae bacterium]